MNTEIQAKLIKALRTVPAKPLKLIDLVNQVAGPDGVVNTKMLEQRQDKVNLAVAEARAYTRATQHARKALSGLLTGKKGQRYDIDDDD